MGRTRETANQGRGNDRVDGWPSLPAMMLGRARQWGGRTHMRYYAEGGWRALSWAEFARQVGGVARGLRQFGIVPGDRVVVVSENRPEVSIAETAIMCLRAIPVPAYTTSTTEDWRHLIQDCGAVAALTSTAKFAARLREAASTAPYAFRTLTFADAEYQAWQADTAPVADIEAEVADIPPGALACLLYSSGTSGSPRGVMLPHRAVLANCRGVAALLHEAGLDGGKYLSFLPLSHAYEHTVGLFILPSCGFEVWYSRGVEHLATEFTEVRPHVVTVVPRVLELIRTRIEGAARKQSGVAQRLFQLALATGRRRADGATTVLDRIATPVLDRLVRSKVQARFGGRLVFAVSGGARLEPDTAAFFVALGVPILQGYGQTEAGPVVSVNRPHAIRAETVGPPLPGVEVRIAGDGEILVRGDLVMDGYWNKPDATAKALDGGWLHTGDVGGLDAEGHLRITDRKRDMIVLPGGEKVWPARVEGLLAAEAEVLQAVVAATDRAGLCALLVPTDGVEAEALSAAVQRVNARLAAVERVRRFEAVPPFTIENGLLTPSHKVRRALVLKTYADRIAALRR